MPRPDPTAHARRLLVQDRWAAVAGAKLVELREGYAKVRMRLRPDHLNGVGVAQGGAIFTLADFAFAAASNSHGTVAVALDVSITFARASVRGVLTAEAREESLSRRVSVCNVRVTDAEGQAVAFFRGTAFRKEASAAPSDGERSGSRMRLPPSERGAPRSEATRVRRTGREPSRASPR